ncbi:hypothetical protein CRYUN_Cryun12cG0002600 [Craigia yunnanensis]
MEQNGVGSGKQEQMTVIELSGNDDNNNTNIDTDKLLWEEERAPHGQYYCYVNSLSSREMNSLTAICDAFLPSLCPVSADSDNSAAAAAAATFYQSSASMSATPQRVGIFITNPSLFLFPYISYFS